MREDGRRLVFYSFTDYKGSMRVEMDDIYVVLGCYGGDMTTHSDYKPTTTFSLRFLLRSRTYLKASHQVNKCCCCFGLMFLGGDEVCMFF